MQLLDEWQLPTKLLARLVLVYDRLESTNSHAASLADDPANDGVAVLARAQSAGRGQHGRTWQCPEGMGILLSLLLFPSAELRRPVVLAAWAANAVCETIRLALNVQARIKWPNDVLIQGRKVCGILVEQARGTVVGIGLNVHQPSEVFEAAGLPSAASLEMFAEKKLDLDQVARLLLEELDEQYSALVAGDWKALESCWKWRVGLLGKQVAAECVDGLEEGRLVDMTFAGLELEDDRGDTRLILPERIKQLAVQQQ